MIKSLIGGILIAVFVIGGHGTAADEDGDPDAADQGLDPASPPPRTG